MNEIPAPARTRRREAGEVFGTGFTLFADMLLAGLLTSAACLPVVTAPAAFAAASSALRQAVSEGAPVGIRTYFAHLRAHLTAASLAGGLLTPLFVAVLLVDAALVRSALPGASVLAPALVLVALGAAVSALRAATSAPAHPLSLRDGLLRSAADPRGTFLLAAGVLLAAVLAWSIPLLTPLLPGPLAFAATVVDIRYTASRPAG